MPEIHKLSRIVDVAKVQRLTDLLHEATGISISVTDPDGAILADSGWQEVCGRFHQASPETRQVCRRKEARIALQREAGRGPAQEPTIEKCRNGLTDVTTPLLVMGRHVGHFVAGQFLLSPLDTESFTRRALQSGFDEAPYLNALSKIPVIDEAKLRTFLESFSVLIEILAEASVRTLVDEMGRRTQAEKDLYPQTLTLEDVNTALRALLSPREEDKRALEENILSNVRNLILPYVEKLKGELSAEQTGIIDIIEANLKEITSPVVRKMQTLGLTAREITVASLLKEGKKTKQIGELLDISPRAVEFHRYNIRQKLGLAHKKTNLRSYLLSIT